MDKQEHIKIIQEDFKNAQSILTAIVDETRQIILLVLMESDLKTECVLVKLRQKHISCNGISRC
nr:hypothetical protein [Faecalicatena contorta]